MLLGSLWDLALDLLRRERAIRELEEIYRDPTEEVHNFDVSLPRSIHKHLSYSFRSFAF